MSLILITAGMGASKLILLNLLGFIGLSLVVYFVRRKRKRKIGEEGRGPKIEK